MTIHFGPQITFTPTNHDTTRESTMSQSSLSLNHHLSELQQVAQDLRVARSARPTGSATPNRIRLALGRAFLAAADALLSDGRRRHATVH